MPLGQSSVLHSNLVYILSVKVIPPSLQTHVSILGGAAASHADSVLNVGPQVFTGESSPHASSVVISTSQDRMVNTVAELELLELETLEELDDTELLLELTEDELLLETLDELLLDIEELLLETDELLLDTEELLTLELLLEAHGQNPSAKISASVRASGGSKEQSHSPNHRHTPGSVSPIPFQPLARLSSHPDSGLPVPKSVSIGVLIILVLQVYVNV